MSYERQAILKNKKNLLVAKEECPSKLREERRMDYICMFFVYILQSINYPKEIYKGHTENLKERLNVHNTGIVPHTSKFRPWKIIFFACFPDKQKAIEFEKYLKTASGIAFMRKRLINKN